jgi:hypothetical protein
VAVVFDSHGYDFNGHWLALPMEPVHRSGRRAPEVLAELARRGTARILLTNRTMCATPTACVRAPRAHTDPSADAAYATGQTRDR